MKKIFKILGISFLTCFSFYYTDKVVDISKSKDPIMIKIIEYSNENNIMAVSSVIKDNIQEAGNIGYSVDIEESYRKMKKIGKYDENLIVYEESYPDTTIKENLDKYVVKSNTNKYLVSLIIIMEDNDNIDNILGVLKDNEVNTTFFIKDVDEEVIKKISNLGHNIGIVTDVKNSLSVINKYNSLNTYCYTSSVDDNLLEGCSKLKLNTILKEKISKNVYHDIKENLGKGVIFAITNSNLNIRELDLSIKYIKQKGYNVIDVDKLLNES